MAEALALGSSILAFVTITAQLSKIVKDVRDVVKDAPEDIARVVEKISSLECLLNEIHNQDTSTANPRAGNRLTKFWASRSGQLRRDFSLYQAMADKLALQLKKNQGPISSAGIRFHWFFKRATVRELDGMLQENIETFKSILGLLTYDTARSSSFDIKELKSVSAQSVEAIKNLPPIIEQALASCRSDIFRSLQLALPFELQASKASMARNPAESTVSICFNSWYTYALPFGTLRVTRGVEKLGWNKSWRNGPTKGSTNEEATLGVMFDFSPAPWLMAKAVIGTFVLHRRKFNDLPGLTHMISTANMLPRRHQALIALQSGQVSKLQELFNKGLATPNDRDDRGRSLLHMAATKRDYEMCALLIREGADCNAVDDYGRTPLNYLLGNTGEDRKGQTVALLDSPVEDGGYPAISNRDGISACTSGLVNGTAGIFDELDKLPLGFDKFSNILDDLEEIDELDPIPLAMSLCAVHSGKQDVAAKVEPAVKEWLKNYHKHGFIINFGDADALRVLSFQALQQRAPELTTDQAEVVLRFAFTIGCSVDVIRALVRPGTVNGDGGRDGDGGIPLLTLAAGKGDLRVVDILLDAGADGQADDLSALRYAVRERQHHVVKRLLGRGESPLMALNMAIERGTLDLVEDLIERIPDVSARLGRKDSYRTVLFTAAEKGHTKKVELLIERGIDVLARDTNGRTASALGRLAGYKAVAEYLEGEEEKARLKNKLKGIPNEQELDPLAVLAMAVSQRDSREERSSDPEFRIAEQVNESEPVYHVLDSWGSLKALTTGDAVLIVSGLCVVLAGACYVAVAKAIRFSWQNRKYVTVRNVKWVGFFASLILSPAYYIGYNAGQKR